MSKKTASKTKGKASYVEVAKFGNKAGELKTSQYGKTWQKEGSLVGMKPKAVAGCGKVKVFYGPNKPLAGMIKEGAYEVALANSTLMGMAEPTLSSQDKLETQLADKLVDEVAGNGTDVNALCRTYQLKREELGRLTGFSLRALAEWARGKLPSQPAKRRLQEVRRLLDALAEIVKRESIPKWLHQPNPAFERLTPLQVIELGEIDRLWAMVHDLGSGQPE